MLLKRYRASFKPAEPPKGYQAAKKAEYKQDLPTFYLESGSNIQLANNYSAFADFFMMDDREVRKLAKKHKISLRKEEDVIRLVDLLPLR